MATTPTHDARRPRLGRPHEMLEPRRADGDEGSAAAVAAGVAAALAPVGRRAAPAGGRGALAVAALGIAVLALAVLMLVRA